MSIQDKDYNLCKSSLEMDNCNLQQSTPESPTERERIYRDGEYVCCLELEEECARYKDDTQGSPGGSVV